MADSNYVPAFKIEAWPPDDREDTPTELIIEEGELTEGHPDLSAELTFRMPQDFDKVLGDFITGELLQRGSRIRCTLSEDNFVSNLRDQVKIDGRIWEVGPDQKSGDLLQEITVRDDMARARGIGMNISKQTRMLLYTVSWDNDTAGVWDASDPDFLADIPIGVGDGTPAGAGGEEFVPEGLVSLRSRRNDAVEEAKADIIQHTPDTYAYSASKKEIYFKANRGAVVVDVISTVKVKVNSTNGFIVGDSIEIVSGGTVVTRTISNIDGQEVTVGAAVGSFLEGDYLRWANRTWTLRVYYYDPTDDSNTVKHFLENIFQTKPWSSDGGMGRDIGDLDFDDIFGFDGVTALKIRSVIREKTQGNIQQLLEDLREAGLIGNNYRIRQNPADRKITGRALVQNDGAALVPRFGVLSTEERMTAEGVAGRVEVYSQATSPENFALKAVPTLNLTGDFAGYLTRGDILQTIDGRGGTQFEVYKRSGIDVNSPPISSDEDFAVYDLGEVKEFRRVQLRGCRPKDENGDPLPMYLIQRMPQYTVSASEEPISASNPGIPIDPSAIDFTMEPTNIGANNGVDLDAQATNLHRARYFVIRVEQDCLYRGTDKITLTGTVIRESWVGWSEFAVLGDGRYRYDRGAFKGQVPFAEIVKYATEVDVVTDAHTFTVLDASWISVDDYIQVMRAGTPHTVKVLHKTGSLLGIDQDVTGIANGDQVGQAQRWKFTLAGTWEDLLYPKLHDKIVGTTDWIEILDDERPADISEAEGLAVERLVELIKINREYKASILYDSRQGVGVPIATYTGDKPWEPTKCIYKLNKPDGPEPAVVMELSGTDYEAEPE